MGEEMNLMSLDFQRLLNNFYANGQSKKDQST